MGYIYKVYNDINNKVYIGLTKHNDAYQRWLKHVADYKTATNYSKRPLYEAINKYGLEHFHFEIIEETPNECLSERERFWIIHYNSYIGFDNCQGYNATMGGDAGHSTITKNDEQKVVSLFKEGYSCNEIVKKTTHNITTVSNILRANGFNICQNKNKICQINKNDNSVINIFESQIEANRFLGKTDKDGHIGEACKGLRKTAYGYKWKYYIDIKSS